MYTLLFAAVSFLLALLVNVFVVIPFFNLYVGNIMGVGLVVSNLDMQVITVLSVLVMSAPLTALFFVLIDTISTIAYKARTGY